MDEERAENESPSSKIEADGINEEEESKRPQNSILVSKTNIKEGRLKRA